MTREEAITKAGNVLADEEYHQSGKEHARLKARDVVNAVYQDIFEAGRQAAINEIAGEVHRLQKYHD